MIRINLLAVERPRSKKVRIFIPPAHRVTIAASMILIATVLGIGWWFLSLRQQSMQIDRDIITAEAEAAKLRSVLAQVQKFEARKAQLTQRVTLIEQLRRGQSAPVHVLDEISKSMPDRLWLTEVRQVGSDFTINGFAVSLPSLSDFVANLEGTKWFERPVEILDSQVMTDPKVGDLVKFSIKAVLNAP
jgi:type IV pilus assembly protein PilN